MTSGEHNPSPTRLPGGLTEADLLALVEGEALPPDRAALVARALAANPAMARELDAMKRDRAGLRSFGDEAAPSGLMEAVGAALQPVFERQMLLGLAEGEPVHEGPPVSMVVPRKNPFFAGQGRTLAMAAGLALVAGGVVFTAMSMSRGPRGSGQPAPVPGPIAVVQPEKPLPIETGAPVVPPPVSPGALAIAKESSRGHAADAASRADDAPVGPPAELAEAASIEPVTVAAATGPDESPVGPLPPASMEMARALALASEHRLVVHVFTSDGRFDRVTDRLVHPRGAWQLAGSAPAELASILDPRSGLPLPEGAVPDTTRIAGMEDRPGAIDVGPPAPSEAPALPSVYVLSTRLDEATFAALGNAMRDIGAEVILEEAAQPLPIDPSPVTAANAVLWWSGNPSAWASWGSVPVVIQR